METDFRRLVASVARWIIANDANDENGAKQTPEQRELVSLIGQLEGKLGGTVGFNVD